MNQDRRSGKTGCGALLTESRPPGIDSLLIPQSRVVLALAVKLVEENSMNAHGLALWDSMGPRRDQSGEVGSAAGRPGTTLPHRVRLRRRTWPQRATLPVAGSARSAAGSCCTGPVYRRGPRTGAPSRQEPRVTVLPRPPLYATTARAGANISTFNTVMMVRAAQGGETRAARTYRPLLGGK